MKKRGIVETPPALPPKLHKHHRNGSNCSSAYHPNLPPKSNHSGHQSSKGFIEQTKQSNGRENGFSSILSLSTADLKGKPRDELVLMLLRLNHEKANLLRWKDYFNEQITALASIAETDPKTGEEVDSLCLELKEVESQLKASTPIITFLNKQLRMNDVCGGGDCVFDSPEYEKPTRLLARQKSINFLRREEEREVARALEAEMYRDSTELVESYGVVTSSQILQRSKRQPSVKSPRSIRLQDYPEEPAFRERRIQLESELKQLDDLWKEACEYVPPICPSTPKNVSTSSRRQKPSVLRRVESRRLDTSEVQRPRSACDVRNLAYVPRRSTRQLHRSDLSSSSADLDQRPSRSLSQGALHRSNRRDKSRQGHSINRAVSSTSLSGPSLKQTLSNHSDCPRKYPTPKQKNQAVVANSSFLMEPTSAVQSRWKISTDEEDGSSSNSVFSSSPPPPQLPPPLLPGRRQNSTSGKSASQLNRWRSFGDNLAQVDPEFKPETVDSKISERLRNPQPRTKSPTSDSSQSTLHERGSDLTPIPSEDPYEETPFVESQYLTPRVLKSPSSNGVNRPDSEEKPINPNSLTAAVEYVPSEANYDW